MANAKARISLTGTDPTKVDSVCAQIKLISERTGVSMAGPIPLPTKKLIVPARISPRATEDVRRLAVQQKE